VNQPTSKRSKIATDSDNKKSPVNPQMAAQDKTSTSLVVCLLEQDEQQAECFELLLSSYGHRVKSVYRPKDVFPTLTSTPFSLLIIADFNIPKLTIIKAVTKSKVPLVSRIPILVLNRDNATEKDFMLLDQGADEVLPYNVPMDHFNQHLLRLNRLCEHNPAEGRHHYTYTQTQTKALPHPQTINQKTPEQLSAQTRLSSRSSLSKSHERYIVIRTVFTKLCNDLSKKLSNIAIKMNHKK